MEGSEGWLLAPPDRYKSGPLDSQSSTEQATFLPQPQWLLYYLLSLPLLCVRLPWGSLLVYKVQAPNDQLLSLHGVGSRWEKVLKRTRDCGGTRVFLKGPLFSKTSRAKRRLRRIRSKRQGSKGPFQLVWALLFLQGRVTPSPKP